MAPEIYAPLPHNKIYDNFAPFLKIPPWFMDFRTTKWTNLNMAVSRESAGSHCLRSKPNPPPFVKKSDRQLFVPPTPNLLCNMIIIEKMRLARNVVHMGEERGVHRVLVGKPEGKRPLGRPRRRWEDGSSEVGGGCGNWMELAQDRDRWRALVSTVKNLRVP
jgi:hypothetical protein